MSSMRRMSRALLNSCALSLPTLALAAAPALAQSSEETVKLGTMVLTAAGFEQLLKDAPASVSVITGEELQKGQFSSLTDALKNVQGLTVTGAANENDIFIRGLSGAYTLIMVDGKRQNSRDARPNGSSGFEQKFIPPASAIERIEIVRGPMSSLYGSDAMGGVVNIITKKVSDSWNGEVSVDATLNGDDKWSDDRQGSFYLSGPLVADKLGLQIWGRKYAKEGASAGKSFSNSTLDNANPALSEADDTNLNARLTWTPTDAQDVTLDYGLTNAESTGFVAPAASATRDDHQRKFLSLSHIGRWDIGTSELSLSRERGERERFKGNDSIGWTREDRAPKIVNTVFDAKMTSDMGSHKLTYGGQFFRAELSDHNGGTTTPTDEHFRADQKALFIEDEYSLNQDLALTFGLRYNDHSEFNGKFTPRAYAVWSATEEWTIKGGISTAYRAPEIRQVAPGFLYSTQKGAGVIVANPDLLPETSTNIEVSALYDDGSQQFGATLFKTDFKDKIENRNTNVDHATAICNSGLACKTWIYENIADAEIRGLELTYSADLSDSLRLNANYTYTHSEQKSGNYVGYPLARTPEHMASLRLDWDTAVDGLSAWAAANYHGTEINGGARTGDNGTVISINGVAGKKYGAYSTVDLGGSYAVNDSVDVNFALFNAFDREIFPSETNNIVEGRRVWLGLTSRF